MQINSVLSPTFKPLRQTISTHLKFDSAPKAPSFHSTAPRKSNAPNAGSNSPTSDTSSPGISQGPSGIGTSPGTGANTVKSTTGNGYSANRKDSILHAGID